MSNAPTEVHCYGGLEEHCDVNSDVACVVHSLLSAEMSLSGGNDVGAAE